MKDNLDPALKKYRLPSGRRTLLPSQVALGETEGGGVFVGLRLEGLQLFGDGRINGELWSCPGHRRW